MAREKTFTERMTEVRYTPDQKAELEEAVAFLKEKDPSINFAVWVRPLLLKEAAKILKRKRGPVDLPKQPEVTNADKPKPAEPTGNPTVQSKGRVRPK